jgi:hypothetical protein
MTYFDVLGVTPDSSDEQVAAAYHQLARQFHPDAHPGASPEQQASYGEAMTRINIAYQAIKTTPRRAAYRRSESAVREPRSTHRPPTSGECDFCGSRPAETFPFEYQSAWLLSGRRFRSTFEYCRQCALAMGRAQQNRTLVTGWWGIAAIFTNFAVVWRNAQLLRRAKQLPAPEQDPAVVAPLPFPAADTKSVFLRGGMWFVIFVFSAAVVLIGGALNRGATPAKSAAVVPWEIGSCVRGTAVLHAVPCVDSHDGRIVANVSVPDTCPADAEGYVDREGDLNRIYCIDDDR